MSFIRFFVIILQQEPKEMEIFSLDSAHYCLIKVLTMENSNNLPEYVHGIPTAKNRSRERRNLITNYYSNLWKKLQREGKRNMIFNDYLGVYIHIIENESDKKTINAASHNWQSTFAVKHLETY